MPNILSKSCLRSKSAQKRHGAPSMLSRHELMGLGLRFFTEEEWYSMLFPLGLVTSIPVANP